MQSRNNEDHPRYPPPPPNGQHHRPSSSFLHHLPPPIPSTNSPLSHFPASPNYRGDGPIQSPVGGHTDPSTWATQMGMDRPGSSRKSSGWSVASPRMSETSSNRLPSLSSADFPHRGHSLSSWDVPSPGSYAMSNARGTGPYSSAYRESSSKPPPLITPASSSGSNPYIPLHPDEPNEQSGPTPRERPSTLPGGVPPSSPAKHPAPSSETDGAPQKKKKRRVALSCAECAKRKQKCNRETPCQHCVARRVPELCVPYTRPGSPPAGKASTRRADSSAKSPGPKDKKEGQIKSEVDNSQRQDSQHRQSVQPEKPRPASLLPTISVRVGRLEAMMNAVINRVDGVEGKALRDWRINHAPATSPPPINPEELHDRADEDQGERPDTMSSTRSRRDDRSPEWGGESAEGDDVGVGGLDRDTSGRNPLPQSMIHASQPVPLGLDYHGTPAEQLQKLFQDCGVSPHKVTNLMRDLPPHDFASRLVEWYFQKCNYVRYPIDEFLFKQAFDTVYSDGSSPSTVIALPLVFIVLATAIRIAPDELIASEDQKRTMSLRMYWSSKSAVIIASAVKAENLQLVETRILTGLYLVLMHERRLAEGWAEFRSALTIGQAIGLHRDGTKLGLEPYFTEYRRRLWSYLVHADATYSCLLGRPPSIDTTCVDTQPPSNLDLSDLRENKNTKPKPFSEPTFATYLILRHGLGCIVAKITQHFQKLQGQTQYRDVENLDAELKQFVADLPPAFSMENPDKSQDSKLWYLPIHRYYIQTEILHFVIILHRPWLLRKLRSQRYALSREACFDAAITDYKIRQAFKIDCPDFFETLLGSSFREFNAAMIAGISMIIDPRAQHANDMRQIVKSFMEQHPHDPKADDFSQKEAAIIYTIYRRVMEMEEKRARRAAGPRLSHDNTSFERSSRRHSEKSGSMAAPPVPTGDSGGASAPGSETSRPIPLTSPSSGKTHSHLSPYPHGSALGPTPPTVSASPEEDHPQKLLDHWLVSNTSFGPGADSTMSAYNAGIGMFPFAAQPPPQPVQPPFLQHGSSDGSLQTQQDFQGRPFDPSQAGAAPAQALSGWMDPSLVAGSMMGVGMANPGGFVPGAAGAGGYGGNMGGAGGDGNSAQYWNALIDGIVGGLPSYDPVFNSNNS
ncbi:hypothetical protein CI109_106152 [Kwoniella shandongensis]|uniref:Uncharacterized protein n=1 Tax=Kwoniella shandongensis TaxID=1734106 RepID=A0A5M6C3I6_9TREE|nr:uncharacterized protein CI109_003760 [Kwoniella shandongensis]KAA5527789.1 hypothetical protein CI109_003760 [Kwoniella shandongensis]